MSAGHPETCIPISSLFHYFAKELKGLYSMISKNTFTSKISGF